MGVFKSRTDLRTLQEAATIAARVCDEVINAAQPGVSSMALEVLGNRLLRLNRSTAPFKTFEGFGHAICLSLNEEIVNGPPSRERVLKEGDLVSIALGSCIKGIHGKAARTRYLGTPPANIQRLLDGTQAVFPAVMEASLGTNSLKLLLSVIPEIARKFELTVIDNGGGAGIGKQHMEWPATPNNPDDLSEDVEVVPGMAFTLMPMFSLGASGEYTIHPDGWTQVAADGALSAHFAETMLMTPNGLTVLSQA